MTERSPVRVRFDSPRTFVNVYLSRGMLQLGVEIGRRHDNEFYSLAEIVMALAPEQLRLATYQTTDRAAFENAIRQIARMMEDELPALLGGDDEAFRRVDAAVSPARTRTTMQSEFGAAIGQGDQAWSEKRFDEAIELYSDAREALDSTRIRRLQFLETRHKDRNTR